MGGGGKGVTRYCPAGERRAGEALRVCMRVRVYTNVLLLLFLPLFMTLNRCQSQVPGGHLCYKSRF